MCVRVCFACVYVCIYILSSEARARACVRVSLMFVWRAFNAETIRPADVELT